MLSLVLSLAAALNAADWPVYGGDAGTSRYSPLKQINTGNARNLKPVWTFHTGDKTDRPATQIQCTPIVIDGIMYVTSAQAKVIALRAATGEKLWSYDPFDGIDDDKPRGVSRGVTYWSHGKEKRIFFTYRARLVSLDANTGKPAAPFGDNGQVDLTRGLDRDITGLAYYVTTPGVVYHDLLILGSTTGEGPRLSAPGHVRAFDVRTGKQKWIFHTIPHPGEFGYETWSKDSWKYSGGTNVWGGLTVDSRRGLVFLATGSPTFDFWGGDRIGDNLFGNSVVALDANTGKRAWHYQVVHHDVWDYDLATAPSLVTLRRDGKSIDALVQVSKMGFVFVFDRVTGKPLFPIEERPVPPSDVPGEILSRTQPFPLKPPPLSRQRLLEEDIADLTPAKRAYLLERYRKLRAGEIYLPPSVQGTLILPGFNGGANWGGGSIDPAKGVLFVNSNENVYWMTMKKAAPGAGYTFDFQGYTQLLDEEEYPAIKPPWGWFTAVDLNTGDFRWRISFGEHPELTARGIKPTGTTNFGGSIATAGDLVFIGATQDHKFRAFDSRNGKVVWETQLETGAYATPCTYEIAGKQYVAVAVGGGRWKSPAGDSFVAFALP
ncbi:MAG TPA: pyrroloquinoline quinone-dependent dehydrogenase [Bryobacteraceae bacterium]|nr:pyrroloquinoline quinone-dependent dehydrogenase [Bryobacteraceae bacterium]